MVGAPPQDPYLLHSELSITNVTAPLVDIVEGVVPDRAPQPVDAHGELALGPLNTNRAKQPPPTMAGLPGLLQPGQVPGITVEKKLALNQGSSLKTEKVTWPLLEHKVTKMRSCW